MKVTISNVDAVNESVVRVDCFTYTGELHDHTNDTYRWYQLAIGVDTFTEKNVDGSINILSEQFQEVVSAKILQTRNTSELAHILNGQELVWELNITDANDTAMDTPMGVEGMKLAQATRGTN